MEVDKGSQRIEDDTQFDEHKVYFIAYSSLAKFIYIVYFYHGLFLNCRWKSYPNNQIYMKD